MCTRDRSDVERDQVQRLLDSGAISDLMDWARTVQAGDPAFKDFADKIRHLARLGDLAAIRELCASARG